MTNIDFCTGRGAEASHSKGFKCLKRVFNFKNLFTTHNSQFTKAIAFTLAETLIVMGIIGVVAALTLPNLNSSTGDKEKVAKVKKIYQNLNDALGRAEAVYGPYETWYTNDTTEAQRNKRLGERMTEFMKVSKTCGIEPNKGCFTKGSEKYFNGENSVNYEASNRYKIITVDGTSIAFSTNGSSLGVVVDIDGPNNGLYTNGKDVFNFTNLDVNREYCNVIYPSGIDIKTFDSLLTNITKFGTIAATWVINYDNMDYLKLKNGKCPNGTVPTESNPRCK